MVTHRFGSFASHSTSSVLCWKGLRGAIRCLAPQGAKRSLFQQISRVMS